MERNKITYGSRTFSHSEIKNLRCYKATSLLSLTLESDTLQFDVERNDTSLVNFKQNDKLVYSYNGNAIGTFYLQSVKRIGATRYRFSAVSVIGLLAQKVHAGGIYTGQTVATVVADICNGISYSIKSNLKSITLYGWLPYRKPPESSARDNLAQVLFAIGASARTNANGVLYIEDLSDSISGYVNKDNIYTGPSVSYGAKVSAVSIIEHQYSAGTEQQTLFDGTSQAGDIIIFDEPMHSLSASGFSIQSIGANYAKLSAGKGTLTGKKYIHNTRQLSKAVNSSAAENVKSVKNATLVSVLNATEVLDRMANYYSCTDVIKEQIVYAAQNPGDVLGAYHPYGKNTVLACLQNADIQASGILAAKVDMLVGFKPIQVVEMVDCRQVLTGSGSWTVPAGTKSVTVVCISGGSGGSSGESGSDAETPIRYTRNQIRNGPGAKGGRGGAIGGNGNVIVATLTVTPGAKISYSCGSGGSGGTCVKGSGSTPGSEGGHTTFGTVSSENGTATESGYTDAITGDVYANTIALPGIDGGDGSGATGQYYEDFVRGESVVDRDGNEWTSGVTGDQISSNKVYLDTVHGMDCYIFSLAGSGGGAAVGENGSNGHPNSVTSTTAYSGTGGKGGDAKITPAKQTRYGSGGNGGHGGGGAGGAGGAKSTLDPAEKSFIFGANAVGGMGGKGGDGGDGCVILYYKKAKS